MRLVVARCSVDYAGRLSSHLPLGTRLLVLKSDGSVLVHADTLSYKPLNWMSPPCVTTMVEPDDDQRDAGVIEIWKVAQAKTADLLVISIHEILHDSTHELGQSIPACRRTASRPTCRNSSPSRSNCWARAIGSSAAST